MWSSCVVTRACGANSSWGVSNQEPTNGYRRQARVIPHCGIRAELDGPRLTAVPVGDRQLGPTGLRICEHLLQGGTPRAFLTRSSVLPRRTSRRRIVQGRIQPKREIKLTAGVTLTCLSNSITE